MWVILVQALVITIGARFAISAGDSLIYAPEPWQIGLVTLVLATTAATLKVTGFYKWWLFWRPPTVERSWHAVAATLVALFVLVETFALLTGVLTSVGAITVSGYEFVAQRRPALVPGWGTSYWGPGGAEVYRSYEAIYFWHLMDAIPALEATDTLDWALIHEPEGRRGGAIILCFKILVVLPFITLTKALLAKREGQEVEGPAEPPPVSK